MTYKSGEIYFVRETILGTEDISPFVKIGLVAAPRTSDERLKDHQTGNPRRLYNQDVVETGAVFRVEALMHRLFAPNRISGEWFKFDNETDVTKAIDKAKSLSNDVAQYQPLFDKAEALSKVASVGDLRKVTPEISEIVNQWRIAEKKIQLCSDLESAINLKFKTAVEAGADLKGAAEAKIIHPEPKFNLTQFRKANKELAMSYDVFVDIWKQDFKTTIEEIEKTALDEEFLTSFREIAALVDAVVDLSDSYKLNEPRLLLLNLKSLAEWDFDIADAQLRISVGETPGIDGVCTWNREMGKKATFNKGKFAEDHPDLWLEYTLPRDVYTRFVVARSKK